MIAKKRSSPIIIVLVGEKLAGKEMVANYLVNRYKFVSFRFSKLITEILNILDLPVTRLNQIKSITALRQQFGGGVLAKALLRRITTQRLTKVVIDGIRHPDEFKALKNVKGFKLVYITAPMELRYQRALRRGEKVGETKLTFRQFKNEEKLATEIYIRYIAKAARVRLVNTGSLSDLYKQIDEKLMKVVREYRS